MRKILIILSSLVAVAGGIAAISAGEAHIVNVTATPENALYVHPAFLEFGTVFPQEKLESQMFISFSESFSARDQRRVGNVDYTIKQKPKPRPEYEKAVGQGAARTWCHDNYPTVPFDPNDPSWTSYLQNCYPSLCPYLSKHPDNSPPPGNDSTVEAFHDPFDPANYYYGKLMKFGPGTTTIGNDPADIVTIDLDAPCFKGQCAQDWTHDGYEPPAEFNGMTFGCDLWVETTRVY